MLTKDDNFNKALVDKTKEVNVNEINRSGSNFNATANTVNEATNGKYSVIAAGDCGNLENVAKAIRSKYPNKDIIIAADNDHIREDNVGLKHATQTAKNVGAMLVYPSFSFGVKASDFNDLKKISGIEVVRSSIREQYQRKYLMQKSYNKNIITLEEKIKLF